jgi:ribosomal protein S18 acetylase RimI-like enzyme
VSESARGTTGPSGARTNKFDLLMSQPEILRWLDLNEQEVAAWLAPGLGDKADRSPEAPRAPIGEQAPPRGSPPRRLEPEHGPAVIAKPLSHGDVCIVLGIFTAMSERSRRLRFMGPKPWLTRSELRQLSTVDDRRQALVAYLEDGRRPIGIARLVREGNSAEIAFAVVDEHQHRGIGTALVAELLADAHAAGITEVTALVSAGNAAALALLRRVLNALSIRYEGSDLAVRAALTRGGLAGAA